MTVAVVIPARLASTRLPEKMLLNETGWPLIRHVYEQAKKVKGASRVVIATDDDRIAELIKDFGGDYVMTDPNHPTGTDRLAEVAAKHLPDVDFIVNVQGDEPEIEPENIEKLIALYQAAGDAEMGTLVVKYPSGNNDGAGSPTDPNTVKAVLGAPVLDKEQKTLGFNALYFSRSPIPYPRDAQGKIENASDYYMHLGIYAYRPAYLQRYVQMAQKPLELTEKLEQLRVLEHGGRIVAGIVDRATPGIDTRADYDAFVARWKAK